VKIRDMNFILGDVNDTLLVHSTFSTTLEEIQYICLYTFIERF
jgi:hypothetical protein